MNALPQTKDEPDAIEERREMVRQMTTDWMDVEDRAKGENLETAKRKKEALDRIINRAKAIGIPGQAFRAQMTMLRHVNNARGVLDKVEDTEKDTLINEFADLTLMTEEALPLFPKDVIAQIEGNARKAREARENEDDDSNVVPLRDDE